MFKLLLPAFLISTSALAADCVDEKGNDIYSTPTAIVEEIGKATSCYAATNLAKACAWASLVDLDFAGAAGEVCQRDLDKNQPSKTISHLLTRMRTACIRKYGKAQGTMYVSMKAFCILDALDWIVSVSSPLTVQPD